MTEKEWLCWTLSEGDIEEECRVQNIDYSKITEEQKDEIARRFKKGVEANLENWGDILFEAITLVLKIENETTAQMPE